MSPRKALMGVFLAFCMFGVSFAAAPAWAHGVVLGARLNGANEVPGPGDPDGKGVAWIKVAPRAGQICWAIEVKGIHLPATAAHIHAGPRGVAGPVVVTLSAPDDSGKARGCATAERRLLRRIAFHPRRFYVNVHNKEYPDGAVRGQLRHVDPAVTP